MKDQDLFSKDGSPPTEPQNAPSSTASPPMKLRLGPRHPVRLLLMALVVLIILAGGYGIFRAVSPPPRQASSAFQQETSCPFGLGAGPVEVKSVRCGWLSVPEDWSQPQGSTIQLAVAIFKTSSPHPAPDPVLVLGGGPGQALLQTGEQTLFLNRDLILLDQRGVGYSQPSLRCLDNETPQACHSRLVKSGIHLNAFTTLQNAADVHALIRALGYQQVNLYSVSYGTRLALTVMRLFPAGLRSVMLTSVFPPQANFFANLAAVFQHAFNVLFQGCATNPHCNTAYPHLQTVFYRLVSDMNKKPILFQATDPQTGNHFPVRVTGNDLAQRLFNALYFTGLIPRLPEAIFQISHQDYTPLSLLYSQGLYLPMSMGMFYSVMCSEDMAYTTPQRLEASVQVLAPELRPGVLAFLQSNYSICQLWNVKSVVAVQKESVTSTIPTLIMEGEYDPVTPPANGMLAA